MGKTNLSISSSESRDAWRILARLLLFVPLLFMVAAVNLCLDPDGLFRGIIPSHETDERDIAQALVSQKKLQWARPVDIRLFQKYLIGTLKRPPDVVFLGSSHSLWIGSNMFHEIRIINNAVPLALLPDYLGVFEGYAKRGMFPKRVILQLDPQVISSPLPYEQWLSIKEDTFSMMDRLGVHSARIKEPLMPKAWLNLFSFNYFQRSLYQFCFGPFLYAFSIKKDGVIWRDELFNDGRWVIWPTAGDYAPDHYTLPRLLYHSGYIGTLNRMKPDKELENILEQFIRYIIGKDVNVTLCLLPVHPDIYKEFLEPQNKLRAYDIVGAEKYYRDLAQRLNIGIVGSYDPAACGLNGNDFFDGDHIKVDSLERMLKQKGSKCSMGGYL